MKHFTEIMVELNEAKFKLPSGHKELERDSVKVGSKIHDIVFSQKSGKVHAFINGQSMGDPYRDLKSAKKEKKAFTKACHNDFQTTSKHISSCSEIV